MQPFSFETAFPLRGKFPFHRTALRVERIEFSVVAADVNRAVVDRRCARHRPTRDSLPNLLPALRIHGIDIPIVTSKIDDLVLYHRRADDTRSCRKFPLHVMKLARPSAGVCAGVRGVAAEHRLRFCRTRQGEEQKKKRCYFHKERVFLSPRWEKVGMSVFYEKLLWRLFSCCCGDV